MRNLILFLLVVGCDHQTNSHDKPPVEIRWTGQSDQSSWAAPTIYRFHDDFAKVSCWAGYDIGISCIPDSQIYGDAGK